MDNSLRDLMENMPIGFHFTPTDAHLIDKYLSKKAAGQAIPYGIIIDRDLYSSKPPWEMFDDDDVWWDSGEKNKKTIYVFTRLKLLGKNGGTRVSRTAGCGSWHGETGPKPIINEATGQKIGKREMFVFVSNDENDKNKSIPHWIMHEYSLPGSTVETNNYVLCKITKDESKQLKVVSKIKKKNSRKRATPPTNLPHQESDQRDNHDTRVVENGGEGFCYYDQEAYNEDLTSCGLVSTVNPESNLSYETPRQPQNEDLLLTEEGTAAHHAPEITVPTKEYGNIVQDVDDHFTFLDLEDQYRNIVQDLDDHFTFLDPEDQCCNIVQDLDDHLTCWSCLEDLFPEYEQDPVMDVDEIVAILEEDTDTNQNHETVANDFGQLPKKRRCC